MARQPYWFAQDDATLPPAPQWRQGSLQWSTLAAGDTLTRSYGTIQIQMMLDGLDPLMHDYLDRTVMWGVYWSGDVVDPNNPPSPITNPSGVSWIWRDALFWEPLPAPGAISAPYQIQSLRAMGRFDTKVQRGPAPDSLSYMVTAWEVFDYGTAPSVGVVASYSGLALSPP